MSKKNFFNRRIKRNFASSVFIFLGFGCGLIFFCFYFFFTLIPESFKTVPQFSKETSFFRLSSFISCCFYGITIRIIVNTICSLLCCFSITTFYSSILSLLVSYLTTSSSTISTLSIHINIHIQLFHSGFIRMQCSGSTISCCLTKC